MNQILSKTYVITRTVQRKNIRRHVRQAAAFTTVFKTHDCDIRGAVKLDVKKYK